MLESTRFALCQIDLSRASRLSIVENVHPACLHPVVDTKRRSRSSSPAAGRILPSVHSISIVHANRLGGRVGIHLVNTISTVHLQQPRVLDSHLPLATSHGNVHEAAGVLYPLLRAALGNLLLLLGLNLWKRRISISFASPEKPFTRQRRQPRPSPFIV